MNLSQAITLKELGIILKYFGKQRKKIKIILKIKTIN